MTVFVDTMEAPFGRMIMCHMWADTRAELFEMADRIGVDLKWFQRPTGTVHNGYLAPGQGASWEHFDISKSKRALAVRHGAIETDRFGPIRHTTALDFGNISPPHIQRAEGRLKLMDPADRLEICRKALRIAEQNYTAAEFIDSTARRDRERNAYATRIAAIKEQIIGLEAQIIETTNGYTITLHNDLFGPIQDWERK